MRTAWAGIYFLLGTPLLAVGIACSAELLSFTLAGVYSMFSHRSPVLLDEIRWGTYPRYLPTNETFGFDALLGYRNPPPSDPNYQPFNAYGFIPSGTRVHFSPRKGKGIYRVFILGGSSVAGRYIEGPNTISTCLENILNVRAGSRSNRYEVINAGVPGSLSIEELVFFITDIVFYQPDMVVVVNGFSDLRIFPKFLEWGRMPRVNWSVYMEDSRKTYLEAQTIVGSMRLLAGAIRARLQCSYTYWWLKKMNAGIGRRWGMHPLQINFFQMPSCLTGHATYSCPEIPQEYIDVYLMNVRNLIGVAHAHGIKCLMVLQPPAIYQRRHASELNAKWGEPSFSNFRRGWDRVRGGFQSVRRSWQGIRGVRVIDLSQLFADVPEEMFFDEIRYREPGVRRIAEELAPRVLQLRNE